VGIARLRVKAFGQRLGKHGGSYYEIADIGLADEVQVLRYGVPTAYEPPIPESLAPSPRPTQPASRRSDGVRWLMQLLKVRILPA
jgi:hypothetical protein